MLDFGFGLQAPTIELASQPRYGLGSSSDLLGTLGQAEGAVAVPGKELLGDEALYRTKSAVRGMELISLEAEAAWTLGTVATAIGEVAGRRERQAERCGGACRKSQGRTTRSTLRLPEGKAGARGVVARGTVSFAKAGPAAGCYGSTSPRQTRGRRRSLVT
jgi:hypothetical protein